MPWPPGAGVRLVLQAGVAASDWRRRLVVTNPCENLKLRQTNVGASFAGVVFSEDPPCPHWCFQGCVCLGSY